jgi:ribosomal protein L11 methyltransferase
MSRRNKTRLAPGQDAWCWRRWIATGAEDAWRARLAGVEAGSLALTQKPNAARILLSVYAQSRAEVEPLRLRWQGALRKIPAREWLAPAVVPPLRIGRALEIVHDEARRKAGPVQRLFIPLGIAFGGGEHATTSMLLRALARRKDLPRCRVLDLGTGSGILALAARRCGARKIAALDFDAGAVRTARENEALNFPTPLIQWRHAEVKRLRARAGCDLVLANLFSGILCQAARQIADSVAPGGELWLSGILRGQEKEVVAAYRRKKLRLVRAARRGRWVMLQWRKPRPLSNWIVA